MGLYYAIYWLQQMYQRAWSSLSLLLSEAPISITTSSQHIRWINVRYILLFSFKIQKKISGSSKLYECNGVQPPPLNSHNKYYHVFILKLFIIIIYKNTIISMYDYVLVLRRTFFISKISNMLQWNKNDITKFLWIEYNLCCPLPLQRNINLSCIVRAFYVYIIAHTYHAKAHPFMLCHYYKTSPWKSVYFLWAFYCEVQQFCLCCVLLSLSCGWAVNDNS